MAPHLIQFVQTEAEIISLQNMRIKDVLGRRQIYGINPQMEITWRSRAVNGANINCTREAAIATEA